MNGYWIFQTAMGDACMVSGDKGLKHLLLPGWDREKMADFVVDRFPEAAPGAKPAPEKIREAITFVQGCLEGTVKKPFAQLDLSGLREFQKQVLQITCKIEPGQTRSYAWAAEQVGNKKAVRAVAQALARNPLPLFIPCHRVIGKDGSLKGFSAPSGIKLKKYLLDLERKAGGKFSA